MVTDANLQRKNLQKLSRMELLELLLAQTRESEMLREKLSKAEEALADRILRVHEAGNLASAVLSVNSVMESAQAAAEQYLLNIRRMEHETQEQCKKLLAQAQADADRIRAEARIYSDDPNHQTEETI